MSNSDIVQELHRLTKNTIEQLDAMWNVIGIENDVRIKRKNLFLQHVTDLYRDMIQETATNKIRLEEEINNLVSQLGDLSNELQCDISLPSEDTLLTDAKIKLEDKLSRYNKISEDRKSEIKRLETKQNSLCRALGKELKILNTSPLPSNDDMHKFKTYLEELSDLKFQREEIFLQRKAVIIDIMTELKIEPSLDFERKVVFSEDSDFQVTDDNMELLEEFYRSLAERKEDIVSKIKELRETLTGFWELLEESPEVRSDFLNAHPGNSVDTLHALKKEIARCQDKKKENIKFFVEKLRKELKIWWNKCRFSPDQTSSFLYFDSDCYTEDLLTLHEMEIERTKVHYQNNRQIYDLIEKREELWAEMINLEQRANQPNRFKNRGGQLLREEKDRKKIANTLPKIEQELLELVEKYELETGCNFLICGRPVIDIIEEAWDEHKENKHLLLSARKHARDNTKLLTPCKAKIGSSQLQPTLTPATASSMKKRKLYTPSYTNSKRTRIVGENILRSAPSKLRVCAITIRRDSMERRKKIKRISRSQHNLDKDNPSCSVTSNYDDFEEGLQLKPSCRSSLFHPKMNMKLLHPPSTVSNMKSPKKLAMPTPQRTPSRVNLRSKSPVASGSRLATAPGTLPIII